MGQSHFRTAFWTGLISGALLLLMDMLYGGFVRAFFDYAVEFQMTHWGYILALAGLPVIGIRFVLRHLQAKRFDGQSSDLSLIMKRAFLERLYAKSSPFFESHFAGELYGVLRDLDECVQFYLKSIFVLGRQVLIVVLTSAVLFLMAPSIAVVQLLPYLTLIIWTYLASNQSRELDVHLRDEEARQGSLQFQQRMGFPRFFASGMQNHLLASSLPPLASRHAAKAEKDRSMILQKAVRQALTVMGMPLLAFTGAYLMIDGQLTYGGFTFASLLAILLTAQLQDISNTVQRYGVLRC
jgi:ABC-type bacteriocin/lantibiotic exporter with double-glycine peptidase domain